eukprot:gene3239-32010_t
MADAALRAQAAARNNAEVMQDWMRDLGNWEETMSKKDEALKETSSIGRAMPPVRNTASPADGAGAAPAKKKEPAAPKQKAIPGGDFRAWDKFDVGAALDNIDAEDSPSQEEQVETEAYRAQKLREHKATEEKEKGNAQYKKGKCQAAIACYTRAIDHDPDNAIYPANRAMAHLKMKRYKEAADDCTTAIKLDKKYTKAWLRRATALVGMGSLEESIPDFEQVLKLDPKNAAAKKELASLPKRIAGKKEKARKAFRPLEHMGDNTTMSKGKSGKPMHRIAIEDIGSSDEEGEEGSAPPSSPPPPANASAAAAAATADAAAAAAVETEKVAVSAMYATNAPPASSSSSSSSAPAPSVLANPGKAASGAVGNTDDTTVAPKSASSAKPTPAAAARRKAAAARRAAAAGSRSSVSPTGKKGGLTAGKFSEEWRRWRKNPAKLFAFFKTFDQTKLHTLLKRSLDADFLADLLTLVKVSCILEGYPVFETLESLSKADRFEMTIMMIEDSEAAVLKEVFASMRQPGNALAGGASTEDVERVAALYNV